VLGLFTRLTAAVAIVMNVNFLLMNGLHANSGGVDAAFIAGELLLLAFASVQALSLDAVLARNGVSGPLNERRPAPRAYRRCRRTASH